MKTLENTSSYKRNLSGAIECVFNHPTLGEIPNGLSPENDADLIAEIESAGLTEEPTSEEKAAQAIEQATAQVQGMLDSEAQARGYDNINSISKYIGFDNAFRVECEALAAWCAACWSKYYELQNGEAIPSDLLTEMPQLEL